MNAGRWLLGLIFGVGATALQLVAIGAINGASAVHAPEPRQESQRSPVVVTRLPRPLAPAPATQALTPSAAARPTTAPAKIRRSALPPPAGAAAQAGLLPLLAGMGDIGEIGGMGAVPTPEAPKEPDRPARVRRAVQPIYPVAAQRDGVEGYVVLRLEVNARGTVSRELVVDSEPLGVFERSARAAARRLEFEPALVGGVASPCTIQKKFRFTLR